VTSNTLQQRKMPQLETRQHGVLQAESMFGHEGTPFQGRTGDPLKPAQP
jgi:hypothetical protein